MINPTIYIVTDTVYADTNTPVSYSDGSTSLSLSFNDDISSKRQNVTANTPGYISAGFQVTATGIDDNGYSIYAQAADGYSNSLTGEANGTATITTIEQPTLGSNLPANSWGFAIRENSLTDAELANVTYNGLPANGTSNTALYTGVEDVNNKQFTLAVAANIGDDKPADHYKTTLLLSVAAGAKDVATIPTDFAGYTTFEEVTKSVCDTIPIGTEGRLKDTRDGKWYWVGRIKNATDDNALCWMTQNLDYNGGGSGSNIATLTVGTVFDRDTESQKQYYDPGDYVYTAPTSTTSGCRAQLSVGLSACTEKGWAKSNINQTVETIEPSWSTTDDISFYTATSYTSSDGKMICAKQADSWFGDMTSSYIPCRVYYAPYIEVLHYHAGNYYNWAAATNNTNVDNKNPGTSICPSGWQLPLAGASNMNNDGSFFKLLNGLNVTQSALAPYYYVISGRTFSNLVEDVGNYGYVWASTGYDLDAGDNMRNAWGLQLQSDGRINPSSYKWIQFGFPVRCVAR